MLLRAPTPIGSRLPLRPFYPWFLVSVLSWPLSSSAQLGVGTLSGRVVDAESSRPIADTVVTATSAALQAEQVVTTDSSGVFRIPNLPPGDYELRVEAQSFRPLVRQGIQLRSGVSLSVELLLLPEVVSGDEVVVVGKAPSVDVGSTRSGLTITEEFTSRLPVASPLGKGGAARSFEQLGELAPTGRNDTYGASVAGTTSPENVYLIDGLSVSDPGFGYNSTPLSIDFIKETNVLYGGYMPEYGRGGGGVIEVITKSGSNEFHGSVFGNLSPWQAAARRISPQDTISVTSRLDASRDIGFDLGGPIVKDKLWFYLGANYSVLSYQLTRDLNSLRVDPVTGEYQRDSAGNIESDVIAGSRRFSLARQTGLQYLGKLTFSPGSQDRIELSHRGTPTRSGGGGYHMIDFETGLPPSVLYGPYETVAARTYYDAFGTALKWTHSSEDKRLSFDTTLGWQYEHTAYLAPDDSNIGQGGLSDLSQFVFQRTSPIHTITDFESIADPSVCVNPIEDGDVRCPVARYVIGGMGLSEDRKYNTYQLRELVTLLANGLGHHIIKAGVELEYMGFDATQAISGGWTYSENTAGTAVTNTPFGALEAPDQPYLTDALRYKVSSISFGAFLQDSWSILDKVTLNVGLRYDMQNLYADQGLGLALPNQWSPRVGLIYDPTQTGRAKLFANYAMYYQTFPLTMMARGGSGEPNVQARRSFADCDPSSATFPASCNDPNNLVHNINNEISSPNDRWYTAGIGRFAVDPDIKPQSTNEFSAGGELEIIPDGRLALTYIHRSMNNIVEDMSLDEGVTLFLGNPGEGIGAAFPRARRNYDAGILSFTKAFSQRWLAQASYTLSYLRGNWEGLFRAQTGQLDPGANSDFDLRSLLVNRDGALAGDRRHEIKLYLARDIPLGRWHRLTVGGAFRSRSGAPTNYLGRHRLYGRSELFLLPRGTGQRLPWVHNFDLHLAYALTQSKDSSLSLTVDIFNLFNFQAVTTIGQSYTSRAVEPITGPAARNPFVNGNRRNIDPNLVKAADLDQNPRPFDDSDRNRAFQAPAAYQTPFTLRVGIKSTF